MKIIFTRCNYIAVHTTRKLFTVTGILLIGLFQSQTVQAQCTPPPISVFCTPPNSFDHMTMSNGNWTSPSTWVGGNVPPTEDISNRRIRITHDVTVQNNNLKLINSSIIYISNNGRLTLRNGDFKIEGESPNSYEALLINGGAFRTSGNYEQSGTSTVLCATNAVMEIGDELATVGPTVFTRGLFNLSGSPTGANFNNKKGYRRLQNVCINVTQDWQNEGTDIYINVCAEVGDRGAISGPHSIDGGWDGEDNGNMQFNGEPNASVKIYNSEFYIANGNVQNSRSLVSCNSDYRLTNGSFQNSSSGQIEGTNNAIWINHPSNGNITNDGQWSWDKVPLWRTDNSNEPSGLMGPRPPESSKATITARFGNCVCGPQGGPLPISKMDVTAALNGSMINVNWTTYDEVNTHHFELERSTDGANFSKVVEKMASVMTLGKTNYSHVDNVQSLLSMPVIYYRVKTIDIDGKWNHSSIISVKLGKINSVHSWPNPVMDKVNFQLNSETSGIMTIQLYNSNGMRINSKLLNIQKGNNTVNFDKLEALTPGIYMVEMQMNGERTYMHKIVKK